MNTYKALGAGLAVANLLVASVASAQTATTMTVGVGGPDLAVSIGGSGITLDATQSSQPIRVTGLPFSIAGNIGGTCQLTQNGTNLGTIGSASSVTFNSAVVVPAGQSVTLPVVCSDAMAGTYNVTLQTSLIPATIDGTSRSITPRGIGGGSNIDTAAVGTLTIGGGGTVTGVTGGTSTTGTGTSTGGSVLGTSTGSSLPGGTTSGIGSSVTPGVPNTGGGAAAVNLVTLALAGIVAAGGAYVLRRGSIAR